MIYKHNKNCYNHLPTIEPLEIACCSLWVRPSQRRQSIPCCLFFTATCSPAVTESARGNISQPRNINSKRASSTMEIALTRNKVSARWPSAQCNVESNKNCMRNIPSGLDRAILLPFIIKSLLIDICKIDHSGGIKLREPMAASVSQSQLTAAILAM
jgi:hypothetical protein